MSIAILIKGSTFIITKNLFMRLIILLFVFSLIFLDSFCQENKLPRCSKEQYVHKKKVFNIIGYSLLGTSTVLFVKGSILAKTQRKAKGNSALNWDGLGEDILGGISGLASIPFFLLASHYKNKAVSLSIHKENNLMLQQNNLVFTTQPTFTLKVIF